MKPKHKGSLLCSEIQGVATGQIEVYNMAVGSINFKLKRLKKAKPMFNEITNGVVKVLPHFSGHDGVLQRRLINSSRLTNAN